MSVILETKNVSKIYKSGSNEVKAVDTASFQIHEGEFIGLVGPSGSGKTTMLAMLAALLVPTIGEVIIDGVDLGKMSDSDRVKFRRENIGFTFQSNNLVPYLTVKENVELMLRLNGRFNKNAATRVEELLDRLGLSDRINNLPNQLSGGQKQRVSIARSLVHNPSVVLADEPTASLDSERAYQVTRLYADLIHEQKKAGVMVTHDMRMCVFVDRIIQISDGKIQSIIDDRAEIDNLINCG
ncbi:MAG: ABC transporter ATP-binding protein [Chloroflexi bacterium]|nr:ABC transporter ATP-binding protein [Chloroflexota bacterium]BCY18502.1 ABC transporter ATP-binding protein [Leptolinea sp. HRD-7]